MERISISAEALTKSVFAPYGDVIEMAGAEHFPINQGAAIRYHDLAIVDVDAEGGHPLISIFRASASPHPVILKGLERHPLGSQAFYPLQDLPYLVAVAEGSNPGPEDLRVFLARGDQGVNYRRNIWHHPLLALSEQHDFLVVDRGGGHDTLNVIEWKDREVEVTLEDV
jgi:ureidoglycolate lyase